MITISRTVDLARMCRVENLVGVAFTGEQGGHCFEISAVRNDVPEAITGSITGRVIRPDGTSVQITPSYCDVANGKAYVTLPGNCYTVPGPFVLVIFNVAGDDPSDTDADRTVIYSCAGYIRSSETGTIVDPENVINVDAIAGMIEDMQDATEAAQEAASFVNSIIAPSYSTSLMYAVGDYCTYSGAMYRCTTATDGAFNPAHWEAVKVGSEFQRVDGDVDDLKSALADVKKSVLGDYYVPPLRLGNLTIAADGTPTYQTNRKYGAITSNGNDAYFTAGQKIGLTSYILSAGVALKYFVNQSDGNGKYLPGSGWTTQEYTIPATGHYCINIQTNPTTDQTSATVFSDLFYVDDPASLENATAQNTADIADIKTDIGDVSAYIPTLRLGNISVYANGVATYQNNRDYGVITPQGSYCRFPAGTVLSLSDYSAAKFFVNQLAENNTFLPGSGWVTSGEYVVKNAGQYILNIQSSPTTSQSSIDALFSLFVVESPSVAEAINGLNIKLQAEFPERYALNGVKVTETIANSWAQGVALMGNKVLGFHASSDGHTGHADIDIYNINDLTTQIGKYEHNTGHCASADYNADVDILLISNGGSADTPTIYLVSDASSLSNNASIEYNGANVCALDCSSIAIGGVAGCFGENGDIIYVLTCPSEYDVNITKTIYKLQLGYGTNDMTTLFPNASCGTYTAAEAGVPNGTAKIWATYTVDFPGEIQGMKFISGKLVVPMDTRVPTGVKTPYLVVVEFFKGAAKVVGTYWLPSLNKNGTQLAVEAEDVFFDGAYGYVDVGTDRILKFAASQL